MTRIGFRDFPIRAAALAAALLAVPGGAAVVEAATLPEIRLSQRNVVPACVTPERLMAFLRQRNSRLDPRFRDIAGYYKLHGEAWRVRWDYAFFQMAIETNFLTYRRPNGRMGDVDPRQNNFAGIGTTGGGVPGDSFPDVSTGVLGQIQHLVVYSGETIGDPVAPRTRLKQDHILAKSRELNRPVRFSDLARRWAVDPKYASSIEWVAERYRAQYCKRGGAPNEAEMLPWHRTPPARAGAAGKRAEAPAAVELPTPSPVRTVSMEDDAPAPTAAVEVPPAVAEVAPEPAEPAEVESEAAREDAAPAADAGFALFAPPAWLAEAAVTDVASREPPQPVLEASAGAGTQAPDTTPPDPQTVDGSPVGGFLIASADKKPAFDPPSGLGMKPGRCVVETATYGGQTTVLVRTHSGADVHYVALSVLDGFEDTMTKSFLSARPGGGETLGTYPTRDAALAQARTLCPES